jgi:hypothetical protein
MAPDDGFRSFSHAIESDPLGVLLAKWQRDKFIGILKQVPDVVEVIPSGSLTRGTQIGRIHDVDLIVVFDKDAHPDFGRGGPESAQAAMVYLQGKLLEKLHPLSDDLLQEGATEGLVRDTKIRETEQRTHVVTCRGGWIGEFTGIIPSAPPVDVMPAVRKGSHLLVPERGTGWIDVDPEKLMRMVAQRQREWKYFTEVVGMVKAWAEKEKLGMKNLAVEVMVLKYCPRPGLFETLSRSEAIARFFEAASKAHIESLEDPAGRCGEIAKGMDYEKLREHLDRAAELARQAIEVAHLYEEFSWRRLPVPHPDVFWHELFGKKYPRGRKGFLRPTATEPWPGKYRTGPATPGWTGPKPPGGGPKPPGGGPKPPGGGPDPGGPHPRDPDDHGPGPSGGPGAWREPPVRDPDDPFRGRRWYEGRRGPRVTPDTGRPAGSPPSDAGSPGRSARTRPASSLWTGVFGSAPAAVSVPLTFG